MDLVDVQELIKARPLDESFELELAEPVRAKYVERVRAARLEILFLSRARLSWNHDLIEATLAALETTRKRSH